MPILADQDSRGGVQLWCVVTLAEPKAAHLREPWETSLGHPWDVDVPETSTVRPQDVPSPGTGRPRDCGAGTSAGRSVDVSGTSTETSSVRPWHIQEASLRGGVRGVLRTSEGVSE